MDEYIYMYRSSLVETEETRWVDTSDGSSYWASPNQRACARQHEASGGCFGWNICQVSTMALRIYHQMINGLYNIRYRISLYICV